MVPAAFRNKTMHSWERALFLGVALALLLGIWLGCEQTILAEKVVRLHVIANSDSAADQALKLQVRDCVLKEAEHLIVTDGSLEAALSSAGEHLDEFTAAAAAAVRAAGYDYPVTAAVEQSWFPTKHYDGFAFPAGRYTALRIVIGEGRGENWWCVLFPPLCLSAVTETVAQVAADGGLCDQEIALITGTSEGYLIKFKAMELWEELRHALS